MANKNSTKVRGITIELGGDVAPLNNALKDVNKQLNSTQSELKDIERLLKLDPSNVTLLEQKQRKLAESIEGTTEKLEDLRQAEKYVQQQMAEGKDVQKQYDALQREIAATENSLQSLRREAATVDNALDDVDERPVEEVADAAKKAEDALEKAGDEARNFQNKLKAGAESVSDAFKPATTAIAGLATAALATVPATEELREDLSKLDQNAKENGVSIDKAREAWKKFAIQSGETDSAVEAVSNLLQAGFTESNLEKAVKGLAGAAQRFPDTLKIESLADSLQETLASGSASGQFAELLDRLGIGAEEFSQKLALCATEAQRQDLVLQTMADAGLNASYESWVKNNEAMLENKEASLELQESTAELAELILPFVTQFTQMATELLNWFVGLDSSTQTFIVTMLALLAAVSPVASMVANFSLLLSALTPILTTVGTIAKGTWAIIAAHPFVAIIVAAALFGDEIQAILQKVDDFMQNVFAADWSQVFGPIMGDAMNKLRDNLKLLWDDGMQILNGIIDFIRGVFTADWERAWVGVYNIFEGIFNGVFDLAKTIVDSVWGLIRGVWNGLQDLLRGGKATKPKQSPSAINSGRSVPMMANGGILNYGSAIVGEAGPELLTVNSGRAVVTPLTGDKAGNASGSGYGSYVDNRQYHFTVSSLSEFVKIQERMEFERQSLRMGYAKP